MFFGCAAQNLNVNILGSLVMLHDNLNGKILCSLVMLHDNLYGSIQGSLVKLFKCFGQAA